jgi:hypothetical protein
MGFAQIPVAVADTASLLGFSPQEHVGIIAKTMTANNGVFGTTSTF